ncbi:hypothetical protein [Petrachloros mirabilis]
MAWGLIMTAITLLGMLGLLIVSIHQQEPSRNYVSSGRKADAAVIAKPVNRQTA